MTNDNDDLVDGCRQNRPDNVPAADVDTCRGRGAADNYLRSLPIGRAMTTCYLDDDLDDDADEDDDFDEDEEDTDEDDENDDEEVETWQVFTEIATFFR